MILDAIQSPEDVLSTVRESVGETAHPEPHGAYAICQGVHSHGAPIRLQEGKELAARCRATSAASAGSIRWFIALIGMTNSEVDFQFRAQGRFCIIYCFVQVAGFVTLSSKQIAKTKVTI